MEVKHIGEPLKDIYARLCGFEILRSELYELKKCFQDFKALEREKVKELENLKSKCVTLEEKCKDLENKLEHLENHSRRLNIIFFNVSEHSNFKNLRISIIEIVRNVLGLQDFGNDNITSIFRIGKETSLKVRPILVTLNTISWKNKIILSSFKLKGTGIVVKEDLTPKVRESRKYLKKYLIKAKEIDSGAKWVGENNICNLAKYDDKTINEKKNVCEMKISLLQNERLNHECNINHKLNQLNKNTKNTGPNPTQIDCYLAFQMYEDSMISI